MKMLENHNDHRPQGGLKYQNTSPSGVTRGKLIHLVSEFSPVHQVLSHWSNGRERTESSSVWFQDDEFLPM